MRMSHTRNWLKYWRNGLAEGQIISATPPEYLLYKELFSTQRQQKKSANKKYYSIQTKCLHDNKFDDQIVRDIFQSVNKYRKKEDELSAVSLLIAPLVAQYSSRSQIRRSDKPQIITPLWVHAILSLQGTLSIDPNTPSPYWIRREYLMPTDSAIAFGDTKSVDQYRAVNSIPTDDEGVSWKFALGKALELMNTFVDWKSTIDELGYFLLEDISVFSIGTADMRFIEKLLWGYDVLIDKRHYPPLLTNLFDTKNKQIPQSFSQAELTQNANQHLGHMGVDYGLAASQRTALHHITALDDGQVIAINGPPGTGKTTLIQDVVATLWIRAAIEEKDSLLMFISSTNNRAVRNVLARLSENIDRWLPDINGIAINLVNSEAETKESKNAGFNVSNSKGIGLPEFVYSNDYVEQAKKRYLEKANQRYGCEFSTVEEVVKYIHGGLVVKEVCIKKLFSAALDMYLLNQKILDRFGSVDKLKSTGQAIDKAYGDYQLERKLYLEICEAWDALCGEKLIRFFTFFNFFSKAKAAIRKRHTQFLNRYTDQLEKLGIDLLPSNLESELAGHLTKIESSLTERKNNLLAKKDTIDKILNLLVDTEKQWLHICEKTIEAFKLSKYSAIPGPYTVNEWESDNQDVLPNWADRELRTKMFDDALHYWEGRWLSAQVKKSYIRSPGDKLSMWQEISMLTPCFAVTLHSCLHFFDNSTKSRSDFHCAEVDWLIIDEAGQSLPNVVGPAIAMSKRCVLIGDVHQIPPIWSLPEDIDRCNADESQLLMENQDFDQIKRLGYAPSGCSIMHVGQSKTQFSQGSDSEPGFMLTEHRRCLPKIIAYSNELCYNNRIIPKRFPKDESLPWPQMGYAHIKGKVEPTGSSKVNRYEAKVIAHWLFQNHEAITSRYENKKLGDCVGIITPMNPQATEIKRQITTVFGENSIPYDELGFDALGTVHRLQGGEKPIILFSPVYTAGQSCFMLDPPNEHILNVAVSRAQDSFLVFGDVEIFDPFLRGHPRGELGVHLFASLDNELTDVPQLPREDIAPPAEIEQCHALECHQGWLADSFKDAKKVLHIVSPFLTKSAIEVDSIINKTEAAVKNGVSTRFYIDYYWTYKAKHIAKAEVTREFVDNIMAVGGEVYVVKNIHTKLIGVDSRYMIQGSFNWLSANRTKHGRKNMESSLRYHGVKVERFLKELMDNIESRIHAQYLPEKSAEEV